MKSKSHSHATLAHVSPSRLDPPRLLGIGISKCPDPRELDALVLPLRIVERQRPHRSFCSRATSRAGSGGSGRRGVVVVEFAQGRGDGGVGSETRAVGVVLLAQLNTLVEPIAGGDGFWGVGY